MVWLGELGKRVMTSVRPRQERRRKSTSVTTIHSLQDDILCTIFTFLDLIHLVRSSLVSKSWNSIIGRCRLLPRFLHQNQHHYQADTTDSFSLLLEDVAMDYHRSALVHGSVHLHQWPAHPSPVSQCRIKRAVILTGVGDKVVRLWSSQSYKCLEEYSLPDTAPLLDFDFDESKVVGLIGTRICILRRHGSSRSIFPKRQGMFSQGLCMRYIDPDAVVGCDDGTVRVFDMYSQCCSQIIRMHNSPVTCMALGENQLIVSGSCLGSVTVSGLSCDGGVAKLRSIDRTGIKTLCYNPSSQLVFAGSTSGHAACWDLRKMKSLWEVRLSTNVLYSMQHLQNDTSTLVVGGIDGVLRIVDQNTGEVVSRYAMVEGNHTSTSTRGGLNDNIVCVERKKVRRLGEDASIDDIPSAVRPPIKCLAVGMEKVVTTHNNKYIRVWRFERN